MATLPTASELLAELHNRGIILKISKKSRSGLQYSRKGPLPREIRQAIEAHLAEMLYLLQKQAMEEHEEEVGIPKR